MLNAIRAYLGDAIRGARYLFWSAWPVRIVAIWNPVLVATGGADHETLVCLAVAGMVGWLATEEMCQRARRLLAAAETDCAAAERDRAAADADLREALDTLAAHRILLPPKAPR